MKLYSFFNSSASYRVRIALALKGIDYQSVGVNIRIGQQNALEYRRLNPVGLVPALMTDEGESLGQSLAIADWLDRHYPQTPLLPQQDPARMRVLEIVYAIACDIHPINNMRVLRYLSDELKVSEEDKQRWYAHWVQQGLSSVEQLLRHARSGAFCVGETPTLADCCLVPQWANAQRMGCDLSHYPELDPIVAQRVRHVLTENARTVEAATALEKGDLKRMGELMAESHASMRNDFEITVPQIDALVEIVKATIGDKGGVRMTGGGFGGCIVALVPEELVDTVQQAVAAQYEAKTGIKETFYVCKPSQGAGQC